MISTIEFNYELAAKEAATLAELGALFEQQTPEPPLFDVPQSLAQKALAAWQRDAGGDEQDFSSETYVEKTTRHRAGSLALLGLAIENSGQSPEQGDCTVAVSYWVVGDALHAADDAGLLHAGCHPQEAQEESPARRRQRQAEAESSEIIDNAALSVDEKVSQLVVANYWYIIFLCASNNAAPAEIERRFAKVETAVATALQSYEANRSFRFGSYMSWCLRTALLPA